ncbi:MAG TPA: hypothetical protein VEU62_14550 [Bryobacterales bacterium]|nr:hypothetical protein [Bryobacterales bacterium]
MKLMVAKGRESTRMKTARASPGEFPDLLAARAAGAPDELLAAEMKTARSIRVHSRSLATDN